MFTARITRIAAAASVAVAAALALSACGSSNPLDKPTETNGSGSSDTIVIGSQAYYSNEIIAEIYAQALEKDGMKVDRKFNIGQRDAYMPDVKSGAISLFPEYTGNLLEYLGGKADTNSSDDVYAALKKALPSGLTALDYAKAADQDTYTVTKANADKYGLESIGDLSKMPAPVTVGAAPEFEKRPYGPAAAKTDYGVDLAFSATGQTTLEALQAGTVQVADIYSADPAFAKGDLVALKDPKNLILPSNVVPIVSASVADKVSKAINAVSAKLTTDELVKLNVQSTADKKQATDIAKAWLKEQGLS
ncbi:MULTISPECIES: ABC transporter substrate-binding protein [unclassified Microbacterium]|uniref:ABC transporter substrate-binding protein n=1 Tax=unclassified Microbacterium TaxID=2609290 RepID=UPI001AC8AABA|nr:MULTISPECIES: ABC transporter substrate-binding protein [unclassified Microbacterium]MBN9156589.1 ABC transporter substrate-binding protein [Microbacterium sp.]MBS1898084.1 ABC transporter substrate-binding protein [Actinomycetota bacterium]MBS1899966.1 ABC transporter substrate-binding protein [Actinomycetota bacterium]